MSAKLDPSWQKSRIAAKILVKKQFHPLSVRDIRIARILAADPGVTNRLIDQAYRYQLARMRQRHVPAE